MDYETIGILGLMLTPLYGLILWRLKVGREIETKVTKICTFIKMKFPVEAKQVFG